MEGPHGQLRAWLANGLCCNHANGLATVYQTTAAQVAAVAFGANTETGFASQRGAYLDLIDAHGFEFVNEVFVQHVTGLRQHRTILRVQNVFCRSTAQDAVTQGLDDLTAFDDGAHLVTTVRAAVLLGHNQILRHIDQTPCQVA